MRENRIENAMDTVREHLDRKEYNDEMALETLDELLKPYREMYQDGYDNGWMDGRREIKEKVLVLERALRLACRSITSFTPTSQWKSPEKLVEEYLESAEMEMKKDSMENV